MMNRVRERRHKPNFLLVGTTKCGTTSIYNYLREHPDVYMPALKEPRFFINETIKDLNDKDPRSGFFKSTSVLNYNDYIDLFDNVGEESAIGETSPQYLYYYKAAIPAIRNRLGDVKIIIILRNPVHRAFSAYQHLVRDRYEPLSFQRALKMELTRRNSSWSHSYFYIDVGFYYQQVQAYLEHFTQVKILLYEDLKKDAGCFIKNLYEFLEVDTSYSPNVKARYNVSGIPKTNFLHNFMHNESALRRMLRPFVKMLLPSHRIAVYRSYLTNRNLSKISMQADTYQSMQRIYQEEIRRLQDLIGRDLSGWLKQEAC